MRRTSPCVTTSCSRSIVPDPSPVPERSQRRRDPRDASPPSPARRSVHAGGGRPLRPPPEDLPSLVRGGGTGLHLLDVLPRAAELRRVLRRHRRVLGLLLAQELVVVLDALRLLLRVPLLPRLPGGVGGLPVVGAAAVARRDPRLQ